MVIPPFFGRLDEEQEEGVVSDKIFYHQIIRDTSVGHSSPLVDTNNTSTPDKSLYGSTKTRVSKGGSEEEKGIRTKDPKETESFVIDYSKRIPNQKFPRTLFCGSNLYDW